MAELEKVAWNVFKINGPPHCEEELNKFIEWKLNIGAIKKD